MSKLRPIEQASGTTSAVNDFDTTQMALLLACTVIQPWVDNHPLLWESNPCVDATIWMEGGAFMLCKPGALVLFVRPKWPEIIWSLLPWIVSQVRSKMWLFSMGTPSTTQFQFQPFNGVPFFEATGHHSPDTSRSQKPMVKMNTARIRRASYKTVWK